MLTIKIIYYDGKKVISDVNYFTTTDNILTVQKDGYDLLEVRMKQIIGYCAYSNGTLIDKYENEEENE